MRKQTVGLKWLSETGTTIINSENNNTDKRKRTGKTMKKKSKKQRKPFYCHCVANMYIENLYHSFDVVLDADNPRKQLSDALRRIKIFSKQERYANYYPVIKIMIKQVKFLIRKRGAYAIENKTCNDTRYTFTGGGSLLPLN